jgi:hypothetical protein
VLRRVTWCHLCQPWHHPSRLGRIPRPGPASRTPVSWPNPVACPIGWRVGRTGPSGCRAKPRWNQKGTETGMFRPTWTARGPGDKQAGTPMREKGRHHRRAGGRRPGPKGGCTRPPPGPQCPDSDRAAGLTPDFLVVLDPHRLQVGVAEEEAAAGRTVSGVNLGRCFGQAERHEPLSLRAAHIRPDEEEVEPKRGHAIAPVEAAWDPRSGDRPVTVLSMIIPESHRDRGEPRATGPGELREPPPHNRTRYHLQNGGVGPRNARPAHRNNP